MPSRQKSSTSGVLWRIIISTVGLCLIVIAISNLMLYFLGDTAYASVETRRYGGANDGMTPEKRYEWSLDYTFTDKNDEEQSGHTTRRGSDMSVKTDSRVYYFPAAPFINSLESEAKPNIYQPVLIILGIFLIYAMNHKSKHSKKKLQNIPPISYPEDYDDSIEERFHSDD